MTKRKLWYILLIAVIVCLTIALIALLLEPYVAVSFNMFASQGCNSVALDKKDVLAADKVIIRANGESYTVSDPGLIRQIAEETVVATHTAVRHADEDFWIELYHGDRLVRKMNRAGCCPEQVLVYMEDASHWIFSGFHTHDGYIMMSKDLAQKIDAIVEAMSSS